MRKREREQWMQLLEKEREAARKERQELLNRLAEPKRIQIDSPKEIREPEPKSPLDMELAFIGQEVPEGADFGSLRDNGDH